VLFSGDGDFRRLVESAQRKGRRVSVVSTIRAKPPMIADELRRQADVFIELNDLRAEIERRGGHTDQHPHHPQTDDDDYDDGDDEFVSVHGVQRYVGSV
jgi:hypothetical protein